ncbi:hypothetical protein HDC34_001102 [Pseudoclavibacter sp. JAI123]|uniref:hypothetical protein n=1 Tax=Pseudoclavibacter sp. JAI123 TaxID=2723065 RepID=UPI0015C74861|nr:hypothetical protein [Pseudoclavibacter sp. JAI123]NYF12808.1 hypothetical protein [Pseudoclavibacter sp. JAI123]
MTSALLLRRAKRSAPMRSVLACIAVGTALVYLAGLLLGLDQVRVGAGLAFLFIGLGAGVWAHGARFSAQSRVTLTIVTGPTVLVLGSMLMMSTTLWVPTPAAAALAVAAAVSGALAWFRARRDLARHTSWSARRAAGQPAADAPGAVPIVLMVTAILGMALCIGTVVAIGPVEPQFGGFLLILGLPWAVGFLAVLLSLVCSRRATELSSAVSAISLLVVVMLTTALLYEGPRSPSTVKHVDLVNQILTSHTTDSSVSVYNGWPGFFSSIAWVAEASGLEDVVAFARFWPLIIGLIRVVVMREFLGRIVRDPRAAWIAVGFCVLVDTIGADYFSPQSLGYCFAFAIVAAVMSSASARAKVAMILPVSCALAMTHQLSPYIVGLMVAVLVAFRVVKPWWLPALVLVPAIAWTLLHSGAVSAFLNFSEFGRAGNFLPPRTVESIPLVRIPEVSWSVYGLVGGILLLVAAAGWVILERMLDAVLRRGRQREDRPPLSLGLAATATTATGLIILVLTPYGQEGIFRAALFGIPWLAGLAVAAFATSSGWPRRSTLVAFTLALSLCWLPSYSALDRIHYVHPSDIEAINLVTRDSNGGADGPITLLLGDGDLPTSPRTKDENVDFIERLELGLPVQQLPAGASVDAHVADLTRSLDGYVGPFEADVPVYALWSPAQSGFGEAYALQTESQFAELRDAFSRAGYWKPVFEKSGTVVFQLDVAAYQAWSASSAV